MTYDCVAAAAAAQLRTHGASSRQRPNATRSALSARRRRAAPHESHHGHRLAHHPAQLRQRRGLRPRHRPAAVDRRDGPHPLAPSQRHDATLRGPPRAPVPAVCLHGPDHLRPGRPQVLRHRRRVPGDRRGGREQRLPDDTVRARPHQGGARGQGEAEEDRARLQGGTHVHRHRAQRRREHLPIEHGRHIEEVPDQRRRRRRARRRQPEQADLLDQRPGQGDRERRLRGRQSGLRRQGPGALRARRLRSSALLAGPRLLNYEQRLLHQDVPARRGGLRTQRHEATAATRQTRAPAALAQGLRHQVVPRPAEPIPLQTVERRLSAHVPAHGRRGEVQLRLQHRLAALRVGRARLPHGRPEEPRGSRRAEIMKLLGLGSALHQALTSLGYNNFDYIPRYRAECSTIESDSQNPETYESNWYQNRSSVWQYFFQSLYYTFILVQSELLFIIANTYNAKEINTYGVPNNKLLQVIKSLTNLLDIYHTKLTKLYIEYQKTEVKPVKRVFSPMDTRIHKQSSCGGGSTLSAERRQAASMPSPVPPAATCTASSPLQSLYLCIESPSLRGSAATVSLLPVEQFQRKLHSRSVKNLSVPVLKPTVAVY
ncbi:unnamed protein product [Trichogramma brassicae]|uniref:Uncharacterized protein n=1 Tax=Trichogramma brassicae TaxID=86971 RepID=A0A6H5I5C8_9HYME|nr:unnamed protein product [Trichogramma brassicae]